MKLEDIGFYTLSDKRAMTATHKTDLQRCELILTARCNFSCPYCRNIGGNDIPLDDAKRTVIMWMNDGLKNIRFSGGEPTVYKGLAGLVKMAKYGGVERIAISTNGSASKKKYQDLLKAGCNDFSISLDACCSEDGDFMAGGRKGSFEQVVKNIEWLSKETYVTVGVVLTPDNKGRTEEIINFADSLGVSDIRIIPAAQNGEKLPELNINKDILDKYKILKYRENNFKKGITVRGKPPQKCGLVLDDMAIMGGEHYPCIIYMRESGKPIGKVTNDMRKHRLEWYKSHDSSEDEICSKNCLDVCVSYNKKHFKHFKELNE